MGQLVAPLRAVVGGTMLEDNTAEGGTEGRASAGPYRR